MKKELLTVLLGTAACLNLSAAPAEKTEVLPMDGFAVPARWSPAESRVTLAKEKILQGNCAKTACEESGFNDYSSFYRAYTKHFGVSPSSDF